MAKPKIPPELHASVVKLADEGKTSEDLAQWLWREHKIEVSSRQVRALLRRRRTELADVAKGVVREALRKELLPAVRRLSRIMVRARAVERKANALGIEGSMLVLKAQDRQMKAANLLMHYAGLNQPDRPGDVAGSVTDARQALLKRVEALAAKALAEPATEPPVH